MKGIKRIIRSGLLLLFGMLLLLGTLAYAENVPQTGSIKIYKQAFLDKFPPYDSLYKIYMIFPANVGFDEEGNVAGISYHCTDAQKSIEGFSNYFNADAANNISVTDAAVGEDGFLSGEAVQWIKEHITELGTRINYEREYNFANESSCAYVLVNNLEFGYYYVDSSTGSAVSINSTTPNIEIQDKNAPPSLKKTITKLTDAEGRDHSTDIKGSYNYGPAHEATVQMGETVQYTATVTARKGAENYVIMDSQAYGLTLDPSSIRVLVGDQDLTDQCLIFTAANPEKLYMSWSKTDDTMEPPTYTITVSKGTSYNDVQEVGTYTRTWSVDFHYGGTWYMAENDYITQIYYEGANFVIVLPDEWLKQVQTDTEIKIIYDCEVNVNAVVAGNSWGHGVGTGNTARLFYGHGKRIDDSDSVYSARLKIFKYDGIGDSSSSSGSRPLQGVEFVLKDSDGKYYCLDDENGTQGIDSYYRGKIRWVDNQSEATVLVTNQQGSITVDGLTNGTYTLKETKALPGYNYAKDVQIVINNHNNEWEELKYQVNIANKTGTVLPSTGGIGVTVYYVIGVSMLLGGAILVLRKKAVKER